MASCSFPFSSHQAPTVDVQISVPEAIVKALRAQSGSQFKKPEPITREALIDTGAHRSFIDSTTYSQIGLSTSGWANVNSPLLAGTAIRLPLVLVSFRLIGKHYLFTKAFAFAQNIEVAVLPASTAKVKWQMPIIGRDVLADCHFEYDGPKSVLRFSTANDAHRGNSLNPLNWFRRTKAK